MYHEEPYVFIYLQRFPFINVYFITTIRHQDLPSEYLHASFPARVFLPLSTVKVFMVSAGATVSLPFAPSSSRMNNLLNKSLEGEDKIRKTGIVFLLGIMQ